MKEKIKKFIDENGEDIVMSTLCATASVLSYTLVCRHYGFRMTRPHSYDDDFVYFQSISGKMFRTKKLT